MNKSPAEIPIMVLMGIKSPFPFFLAFSLCPLFVSPPLVPPAIDGRERFTARGHTVVLISLSRLGGISTSFAETHHQVPQLCLTKQRKENAHGQPTSVSAFLSLSLCLRKCGNFSQCCNTGTQHFDIREFGEEFSIKNNMMTTTFQQCF